MSNNFENEENPKVYVPPKYGMEDLISRLYTMVDGWDKRKKVLFGIVWFVVAIVLMVAATVPLPEGLDFVRPIVGIPAGVILFGLCLSVIHTTRLKDTKIFTLRERLPQARRVPIALVGVAILMFFVIAANSWLPSGVAGAILVAGLLSVANLIRRTPYESQLALEGLLDPRENPDVDVFEDNDVDSDDILNNDEDYDFDDDGSQDTRRKI